MNLKQAIEAIDELSEEATLFAERMDGEFQPESEVVLVNIGEDEPNRSVKEIAHEKAPGKEYFLEVFIIKEILEGWSDNHSGEMPSIQAALESVIYYAENDAYPESFFG